MRKKFTKYFIPHKGNEYKPHFLRTKSALAVLLFVLLIELGSFTGVAILKNSDFLASVLPGVLVGFANESRVEENVGTLAVNPKLEEAAKAKAEDMAEKSYFSHTSPDGISPWYWLTQADYIFESAGENLAVNFYDSKIVHDAWMTSPAHRENILKGKYTEIGIGMAWGTYKDREALFVVQFFGKPAEAPVALREDATSDPVLLAVADITPDIVEGGVESVETSAPKEDISDIAVILSEDETFIEVALDEDAGGIPAESVVLGKETVNSSASFLEKLFSMPITIAVYILWILAMISLMAVVLKVFIKRSIQYKTLILNGLLLIVIPILLIVGNYYFVTLEETANTGNFEKCSCSFMY